jgi:HSP20 family protein
MNRLQTLPVSERNLSLPLVAAACLYGQTTVHITSNLPSKDQRRKDMNTYSYDQVLTDVREVYEQLTGLPAPKVDVKKPRFPLPRDVDPIAFVQSEINYLNLHLINSGISMRLSKSPSWTPFADIYETSKEWVINLDLPGLTKEDVTVTQANNVLIVRGARRFRRVSEEAQYQRSERIYGAFERVFPLPNYVKADDLRLNFAEGILTITLPKVETTVGNSSVSPKKAEVRKT